MFLLFGWEIDIGQGKRSDTRFNHWRFCRDRCNHVLVRLGLSGQGQVSHIDPARSDYIDLLLTVAMVFLGAVGLTVTLGALVIGRVALKTLRQIKDEAASEAKRAAAARINETVENDLDPKVDNNVREILPLALQIVLADDEHREGILKALVRTGALDAAVGRAIDGRNEYRR